MTSLTHNGWYDLKISHVNNFIIVFYLFLTVEKAYTFLILLFQFKSCIFFFFCSKCLLYIRWRCLWCYFSESWEKTRSSLCKDTPRESWRMRPNRRYVFISYCLNLIQNKFAKIKVSRVSQNILYIVASLYGFGSMYFYKYHWCSLLNLCQKRCINIKGVL